MPDAQSGPAPIPAQTGMQSTKGPVVNVHFFTTRNLSVIVVGAVLITAMVRCDTKDIPKIVEMLVSSHHTAVLGWSIATIILIGSVTFLRLSNRIHDREIERLTEQQNLLQ